MPGPNNAKWGNGSHYCVITLTAPSTPPPSGSSSPSPTPTPTTQVECCRLPDGTSSVEPSGQPQQRGWPFLFNFAERKGL
ncbi:hypothetical protein PCASD_23249 [Puccinia coronata f. sp. avenae]|uniref:Uncharacterized protein n=1 Tax=Puccinia coronata f. sp. avenae TaxID=200324 RepID=A0A2N5TRT8_9BASI|nr:hypothetical protein PCASD_23249 [Puccinia coronata f. sp. avenae]